MAVARRDGPGPDILMLQRELPGRALISRHSLSPALTWINNESPIGFTVRT
jgi:hypothetical protein